MYNETGLVPAADAGDPAQVEAYGRGGAPTLADFDGDGKVEIGVASKKEYIVFDDDFEHTISGGDSLRIEIRAMHYAYNSLDSALANTIFSEYTLVNFSNETYTDMNVGIWLDMDIGCSEDDYAGCDVERSLSYTYNADSVDDNGCNGANAFFDHPPAQGLVVLAGPLQDQDNLDNSFGISNGESINGCGYSDGVIDNERLGLSSFMSHDRTLPTNPFGDPNLPEHYFNCMNSIWRDSTHLVYGGFGHISTPGATTIQANYMFPGSSDNTYFFGTNGVDPGFDWSEESPGVAVGNPKGDRRVLASMGPFTMPPLGVQQFAVAHVTARDYVGSSNLASVALLKDYTDDVRNFYACDITNSCTSQLLSTFESNSNVIPDLQCYPNPSNGLLTVESELMITEIDFFSITGRHLPVKSSIENKVVYISNFPTGLYLNIAG